MSENRSKAGAAPISDCEVRDPRVKRTRQFLQDALGALMRAKGFDAISVQDIAEAATVNRATFYDHYTDKYALLEAMVASGFHRLLSERNVHYDGTCPSAAAAVILATCDYLAQNWAFGAEFPDQSAFEPLIDAAMIAAIRRVLTADLPGKPKIASASDMVSTAAAWAICGAAKQWLRTHDRPPVEEIAPVVLKLVLPILQATVAAPRPPTRVPLKDQMPRPPGLGSSRHPRP